MTKKLILIKVLLALLVACNSPIQLSLPNAQPPARELSESLLPESAPFGIGGPLASSVLLTQWNTEVGKSGHYTLNPIDPLTGENVSGYEPIELGNTFDSALSPDGRTLAIVNRQSNREDRLRLIDLETWQSEEMPIEYPDIRILDAFGKTVFNTDGTQLAVVYNAPRTNYVTVVEVENRNVQAQTKLDFALHQVAFMPDGESLAVFGIRDQKNPESNFDVPIVALFNVADLSLTWTYTLDDVLHGFDGNPATNPEEAMSWFPAVVFAPQQQALYIVHADEDKLTTVDFANRSLRTVEIQPQRSWIEQWLAAGARVAKAKMMNGVSKQAVLSKDGSRLYIVGTRSEVIKNANGAYTFNMTSLGLQVVDVASGIEIAQSDMEASQVQLSPDGTQLYLHHYLWSGTDQTSEEWTDIIDAERLEQVARLDDSTIFPARRLNGDPIILTYAYGNRGAKLSSIDPQSLNILHSWSLDSDGWWLSMP